VNALVVGAANSGADIAMEIVGTHRVWLSGPDPGQVPLPIEAPLTYALGLPVVRFIGHRVLSVNTPIGRKVRPKFIQRPTPLIRFKRKDLAAAGIERVPRVLAVRDGLPLLEDGRALDVANVIWCTGYHPGFSWIDLPVFGQDGRPVHRRGVVAGEPGLYFVGLNFLTSATSATITGVNRDAEYVARQVAARVSARRSSGGDGERRVQPVGQI
jgi:putative flavoprotein involved in K+ transport